MDNSLYYLAVNRQVGLAAEMDMVANNLANLATTGFQREGLAFVEFVVAAETGESVSMADLGARFASSLPGVITTTGGIFDLAIEGEGYFALEDAEGAVLTRAGAFQTAPDGFLVTPNGQRVLDIGQAPIAIPAEARSVQIAADGTISADGDAIAQVGIFNAPQVTLSRLGNTAFRAADGIDLIEEPKIRQGAIEQSNVDPISEISRMIEISRAYETAQSIIEDEDERMREAVRTLGENV